MPALHWRISSSSILPRSAFASRARSTIGIARRGRWAKELLLPPAAYEYRLVVDDEWVGDPKANETVANPFGSHNALLRVQPPTGAKTAGTSDK
jgi:hypothetical protein